MGKMGNPTGVVLRSSRHSHLDFCVKVIGRDRMRVLTSRTAGWQTKAMRVLQVYCCAASTSSNASGHLPVVTANTIRGQALHEGHETEVFSWPSSYRQPGVDLRLLRHLSRYALPW